MYHGRLQPVVPTLNRVYNQPIQKDYLLKNPELGRFIPWVHRSSFDKEPECNRSQLLVLTDSTKVSFVQNG